MNISNLIDQADRTKSKRPAMTQTETEDSARKLQDHVKTLANASIAKGKPYHQAIKFLKTDQETIYDFVARAIAEPVYGLSKVNGQWLFNEETYSTIRDLYQAVLSHLGLTYTDMTLDSFTTLVKAGLKANLNDPLERRLATQMALKPSVLEAPTGLTLEDQLKWQQLTGSL